MSKGAIVAIARSGNRWKAAVYSTGEGSADLVAEVVGTERLVRLVARESPGLLAKTGGRELLVDFLRANGCRISSYATALLSAVLS